MKFIPVRLLQAEGIAKDESQTAMQQEHASLRATISRQSQKVGRLETELRRSEPLYKQQGDLQALVERQREKIRQYQQEIDETKMHMARLEELVHQVQEHSMKEHVNVTPSVSHARSLSPTRVVAVFLFWFRFLLTVTETQGNLLFELGSDRDNIT